MKKNEQLHKLSITDRLTGLCNRRKLDEELAHEINRFQRAHNPMGIILLDIDHFKRVNDTYGHQVGDDVLIAVASVLERSVRKTDIAGRWGGEEFLILCPETDEQGLSTLAENLRTAIEQQTIPPVNDVTASFGVAAIALSSGTEPASNIASQLIARADDALYQAKKQGRNQVVVSDINPH